MADSVAMPEFFGHVSQMQAAGADGYRNPRAPRLLCDIPALPARKQGGALESCLICYKEQPKYAAVGRCGHMEICWMCAVRMRGLLKDFRCPVCKEELEEVTLTATGRAGRGPAAEGLRDAKLGIVYGSPEIKTEVERLFEYTCWLHGCKSSSACFPTMGALEKHLWEDHSRKFCHTCLLGRRIFLHEQLMYCDEDLGRHKRDGDGPHVLGKALPALPAHADCEFCKKSFYSRDVLLDHMYRRHHLCTLCERAGRKGEFYRDYGYLSTHYEEMHHVCVHEDCRRGAYRLVVFPNEAELRVHEVAEHSQNDKQRGSKRQGNRGVLPFTMGAASYRDEQEQRRRQGQGQAPAP
eukprot:CAMPEP_0203893142 /NCGR_PEP_ID=MMETSP0359-20131031/36257_1 /ASSEMBLY_ACC=CAM_ASM_000338 /TAXON_ID=268821 /ORGANISM="Scrippsiella Hangoei, Strain SHTV-5" /LENGTH=350 /DNA_ID=CAMNT_0050815245 /DNA_START=35 /DNA_END=1084 /DNA_ORIENTATION=-